PPARAAGAARARRAHAGSRAGPARPGRRARGHAAGGQVRTRRGARRALGTGPALAGQALALDLLLYGVLRVAADLTDLLRQAARGEAGALGLFLERVDGGAGDLLALVESLAADLLDPVDQPVARLAEELVLAAGRGERKARQDAEGQSGHADRQGVLLHHLPEAGLRPPRLVTGAVPELGGLLTGAVLELGGLLAAELAELE